MNVWAVVHRLDPSMPTVVGLYDNAAAAEAHAAWENEGTEGGWRAERWPVRSEFDDLGVETE